LRHAAQGARVAVVSGGDPGVFAMAAAICAEIEAGSDSWRALGIEVILLRRPVAPAVPAIETVEDAIAWLDHTLTSAAARGV
jgi:precorrin-3B methylase